MLWGRRSFGVHTHALILVHVVYFSGPLSSLVFSLNALFTKPAQSLVPIIVVRFLNQHWFEEFKQKKLAEGSKEMSEMRSAMFALLTLSPVVLASMQLLVFRAYSLTRKHLEKPNESDA